MGGRGSLSYSGESHGSRTTAPLNAYAFATLNAGAAGGTTSEQAIERFREQLMDKKVEYSAYVDDYGYIHALGSSGKEGSTAVAEIKNITKEKGISTIIHNHPHGTSDGRNWGGPLSQADLTHIAREHSLTNGKINKMIATSREGTYIATVKQRVTYKQVTKAGEKVDKALKGKTFSSEKAMWRAVNDAKTKEFAKIGIEIKFTEQKANHGKLVTQKIGVYNQ